MFKKFLFYAGVGAFCINLGLFGLGCVLEDREIQYLSLANMFLLSFALLYRPKKL